MQIIVSAITGLVFGWGLILGGMTDPSKVQGFLDLAGNWNPSLGLVMGGAVLVSSVAFAFAARRSRSLLGDLMRLPTAKQIDRRLVLGSMAFGVGWGLAGFCPGPAVASLLSGGEKPAVFVIAMLAGMAVYEILERRATTPQKAAVAPPP